MERLGDGVGRACDGEVLSSNSFYVGRPVLVVDADSGAFLHIPAKLVISDSIFPFISLKMSYGSSSLASGGRNNKRPFEFGRTYVVRPKGRHQATIVWLHGLGDNGASWAQLLEALPLPNVKWICPTAPTRPVAVFGGLHCTSWFDVGEFSENGPDDLEGLDASAIHVANLLSAEPNGTKLGVGGFSMGASASLYSAACCTYGRFGNGNLYPFNISAVVGLSGWLPCSRSLKNKVESSQESTRKASSMPLLLCHGIADDVVLYPHGEKSAEVLRSSGFRNVTFKTYNELGHYTIPEEMDDVCKWFTSRLGLDGSC
ncbi:lysophospholipase II [Apostasia shenzhenica]|uniref:Lysophospholipase II n=1 Tax=Apostasia shenzhenica TaxID=1088818 RepID=A0A2I0BA52_9ASPA|nr:lysophospholipase II [Apostasia shenzhenica]